jgi:hypothetical protein
VDINISNVTMTDPTRGMLLHDRANAITTATLSNKSSFERIT